VAIQGADDDAVVNAASTLWDGSGVLFGGSGTFNDGGSTLAGEPHFVNPVPASTDNMDYHILSNSAAFNAGLDAGVASDIDGEQRPMGLAPDVGADELLVELSVVKDAYPPTVQPGDHLTYTITVTNTGLVNLNATITDILPAEVSTLDTTVWPSESIEPGEPWEESIVVTVSFGVSGFITNEVQVTTLEGATGAFTKTTLVTDTPDITVAPRLLEATLNPGATDNRTFTVGNVGRADLEWHLKEVPSAGWLSESPIGGVVPPQHSTDVVVTFTAPVTEDIYSTTLWVGSNDPGDSEVPVTVVMTVTEACIPVTGADFHFAPLTPLVGQMIVFTAVPTPSSPTTPVTFTWDFGDKTAPALTTNRVITHSYSDPITYTVAMTATNRCGGASESRRVPVKSSSNKVYLPLVLRAS
jgi:uncharacterized repeat protein (TIGR01451 family)